jgi:hypothetical protein
MSDDPALRDELESAIAARRELPADMEPALVDAFVTRIEKRIAERDRRDEWALEQARNHQKEMVLGSMALSIPLFIVAAIFTGIQGVLAVCVALVVIAIVTGRR